MSITEMRTRLVRMHRLYNFSVLFCYKSSQNALELFIIFFYLFFFSFFFFSFLFSLFSLFFFTFFYLFFSMRSFTINIKQNIGDNMSALAGL